MVRSLKTRWIPWAGKGTNLLERVVGELVLVADVGLLQEGAVRGDGCQGQVAELFAAVGGVLEQAGAVGGQHAHAVVLHVTAVRQVYLRHVLLPRGDRHQQLVRHLRERGVE